MSPAYHYDPRMRKNRDFSGSIGQADDTPYCWYETAIWHKQMTSTKGKSVNNILTATPPSGPPNALTTR